MVMQQTIKKTVQCSGVGVHTGKIATITLKPAPENHGIVFKRVDVTDRDNLVPALWDLVVETTLCTVISNKEGVRVSTIEHLMAAFVGCGIDNVLVEIDNEEMPIMDGSSRAFVEMIDEAGLVRQSAPRQIIRVLEEITFELDGKKVALKPADIPAYSFEIDFNNSVIGNQKHTVQMINGNFRHEISDARTFGLLEEVDQLRKMGLARGGSLENAIVVDRDKILNPEGLRYENEFVRHKILDAIGDLHLAGAFIVGEFEGYKAGHHLNNRILHVLFANRHAWRRESMTPAAAA